MSTYLSLVSCDTKLLEYDGLNFYRPLFDFKAELMGPLCFTLNRYVFLKYQFHSKLRVRFWYSHFLWYIYIASLHGMSKSHRFFLLLLFVNVYRLKFYYYSPPVRYNTGQWGHIMLFHSKSIRDDGRCHRTSQLTCCLKKKKIKIFLRFVCFVWATTNRLGYTCPKCSVCVSSEIILSSYLPLCLSICLSLSVYIFVV